MKVGSWSLDADRRRKLAIAAGIGLVHVGLFALLGIGHAPPLIDQTAPIVVSLIPPPPVPPPPPPPKPPAPVMGGGAPAAPSRIHVTPKPAPKPPELPAPPVHAPEPAIVVGVAATASPTPGFGQGGQGTGSGAGQGEGDGPGSGGTPPLILRGASPAEISPLVPRAARAARRAGRASISCAIRADTRLENCRVAEETPPGYGFGEAALRIVPMYFRYRPPRTADGRFIEGYRVTVFVLFGRQ